ncbi:hypothetical protein P6F26_15155 [Roseibacterium sp. SDUM158017]|uniref:hypothetical protein n=1 Tax=Roseicyclus salinarum TaxID=3036773 RepID=UPI0024152D36|nr:hypothetical protein [Roseibacterium sp. SDUM158017]MDG4649781.1 hypothetical protein [Roseibacterium sp. SDUM158017]
MLLRLGVPAIAAVAAFAAVTTSGERERSVTGPVPVPGTAIELLGEAWEIGAGRPAEAGDGAGWILPSGGAAPAATPQADRAPETGTRRAATVSPRPEPRPRGLLPEAVASSAISVAPDPGPVVVADGGLDRWIVRDARRGHVVAELPLGQALALMAARSAQR